jgi:hypothetical protein
LAAREAFSAKPAGMIMRKLLLVGMGLCLFGALWRAEEEEDGMAVAMSPFLAALALEAGIFLLRRHQTSLLSASKPPGHTV